MENQNISPELSNVMCDQLMALLPAYTLGTATPEEEQLVKAMLPFCPAAAAALTDYQIIGANLVTLFPMTEEPPSSAALMRRVRATTARQPESRADFPLVESQSDLRAQPERPVATRSQLRRPWGWLALAACLVVAFVGMNVYWASQIDTLRRDQQSFLQALAQRQTEVPVAFNTATHHRALLPAVDSTKSSEASFVWNSGDQIGALVVNGLPSLKPGETYQLWLVRDDQSLSLGTFQVDDQGVGVLIFHSSQPVETFQHVGVNIEPAGGTAKPTTPHIIIGSI